MTIIIDPYMIAIPTGDAVDADTVREYVVRLKRWEAELAQPQHYAVSDGALNEIRRLRLQPNLVNLRELFDRYGIQEYSPHDLVPLTGGLLSSGQSLEQLAGIYDSDVWCEIDHVPNTEKVIPEEIRQRMPETVADEFVLSLIYSGYCLERQAEPGSWSIATAPLNSELRIPELLLECDVERFTEPDDLETAKLSQKWPLLYDPEHLYATCDPVDYYERSPSGAAYIIWCRMKAQGVPVTDFAESRIRFGERFVASLLQPRIRRRPEFEKDITRVFEAIIYVLEDIWKYGSDKHHALRVDIQDRHSPQKSRTRIHSVDERVTDKAARVEVSAGATCLRLHYWQCYDGTYEFANVTDHHNDPTIY